jgi:hypothetical protein
MPMEQTAQRLTQVENRLDGLGGGKTEEAPPSEPEGGKTEESSPVDKLKEIAERETGVKYTRDSNGNIILSKGTYSIKIDPNQKTVTVYQDGKVKYGIRDVTPEEFDNKWVVNRGAMAPLKKAALNVLKELGLYTPERKESPKKEKGNILIPQVIQNVSLQGNSTPPDNKPPAGKVVIESDFRSPTLFTVYPNPDPTSDEGSKLAATYDRSEDVYYIADTRSNRISQPAQRLGDLYGGDGEIPIMARGLRYIREGIPEMGDNLIRINDNAYIDSNGLWLNYDDTVTQENVWTFIPHESNLVFKYTPSDNRWTYVSMGGLRSIDRILERLQIEGRDNIFKVKEDKKDMVSRIFDTFYGNLDDEHKFRTANLIDRLVKKLDEGGRRERFKEEVTKDIKDNKGREEWHKWYDYNIGRMSLISAIMRQNGIKELLAAGGSKSGRIVEANPITVEFFDSQSGEPIQDDDVDFVGPGMGTAREEDESGETVKGRPFGMSVSIGDTKIRWKRATDAMKNAAKTAAKSMTASLRKAELLRLQYGEQGERFWQAIIETLYRAPAEAKVTWDEAKRSKKGDVNFALDFDGNIVLQRTNKLAQIAGRAPVVEISIPNSTLIKVLQNPTGKDYLALLDLISRSYFLKEDNDVVPIGKGRATIILRDALLRYGGSLDAAAAASFGEPYIPGSRRIFPEDDIGELNYLRNKYSLQGDEAAKKFLAMAFPYLYRTINMGLNRAEYKKRFENLYGEATRRGDEDTLSLLDHVFEVMYRKSPPVSEALSDLMAISASSAMTGRTTLLNLTEAAKWIVRGLLFPKQTSLVFLDLLKDMGDESRRIMGDSVWDGLNPP